MLFGLYYLTLFDPYDLEDYGTQNYMSGDDLIDIIRSEEEPRDITNDQVEMFAVFVLKYAIHSAPKMILKEIVDRVLREAEECELGLRHVCHVEMLSTSDIAYAVWQYYNSWEDWKAKILDPNLRYSCGTKYTATKGSSDGKLREDGEKMYDLIFKWCRKFKVVFAKDKDGEVCDRANEIRKICNGKASELGMLKIDGKLKKKQMGGWEQAEIEEAAVYDIMEVDEY